MNVVLTIRHGCGRFEDIQCLNIADAGFMASVYVENGTQAISISQHGIVIMDEIAVRRLTRELAVY